MDHELNNLTISFDRGMEYLKQAILSIRKVIIRNSYIENSLLKILELSEKNNEIELFRKV